MDGSPELSGVGIFAIVIKEAAAKRIPLVDRTLKKTHGFLVGTESAESLAGDAAIISSALECYRSDIKRAQDGSGCYALPSNCAESPASKIQDIDEAVSQMKRFV